MIRYANEGDREAILAMGRRFYATIPLSQHFDASDESLDYLVSVMMNDGVLIVGEDANGVCGVVGLAIHPFVFNSAKKVASEVLWWVNPEAQGSGIGKQLLEAVEPACKIEGADMIQMVHLKDSPPQAKALYERMGYAYTESSFAKAV